MTALLMFLACDGTPSVDDSVTDSSAQEVQQLWEPKPYSGGDCPAFTPGEDWVDFKSAERDRSVRMLWPDNPEGAPVWFNWHWLGGTATQAVSFQRLSEIAEAGYIVVVPTTTGDFQNISEWGFVDGQDNRYDLTLFDDVLSCLVEQHDINRARVYSTGMSAGGLWTTHLMARRSEYLAAAAPLSGGVGGFFQSYDSPERKDLPVMLTWGGPDDTLQDGFLDFHEATLLLRDELRAEGFFVIMCEHDLGHLPPPVNLDHVLDFFAAMEMGQPNPWEGGLPQDFWSACEIAE